MIVLGLAAVVVLVIVFSRRERRAGVDGSDRAGGTARPGASRVPALAEALGYLGGVLVIAGLVLVVAGAWSGLAPAGRVGVNVGAAAALTAAAVAIRPPCDPALVRLRAALGLAGSVATALAVGVGVVEVFGVGDPVVTAAVVATAVVAHSAVMWAGRDRPVASAVTLVAALVVVGTATSAALTAWTDVAAATSGTAAGLAVWLAGLALAGAGLAGRLPPRLVTLAVGAIGAVAGAGVVSGSRIGPGLLLALATGVGYLVAVTIDGWVGGRAPRLLLGVIGGITVAQTLPGTLGHFAADAGLVTGLVVWTVGAGLVAVGGCAVVRAPTAVPAVGGAAVIGGAALTGTETVAVATLLGLASALGLLALGMMPGRVVLSLVGALGLLVNVPWAIGWFLPGEDRVALLLVASGLAVVGVALLVVGLGGRLRAELGSGGRSTV